MLYSDVVLSNILAPVVEIIMGLIGEDYKEHFDLSLQHQPSVTFSTQLYSSAKKQSKNSENRGKWRHGTTRELPGPIES
jgi:hypothetical protein